jgi:DNA replication protein DnaC
MEAKIRDGLVQAPLWSYAKPWTQAEKQNPAHWKFAREWNLKDFSASRNLWLWGPEGVGKTALARYLLMRAYLGRYDSEERLWVEGTPHIAEVQASDFELAFVRMTAKEKARLQRLCAVDFLLIDDMANVAWRQWSLMKLWQVVHFRYERRLRTFFTCSMQAAALHDVFVNAWEENAGFAMQLLRRIRPYWELQFTGESLRLLHGADSQPVVKGAKDGKEGG